MLNFPKVVQEILIPQLKSEKKIRFIVRHHEKGLITFKISILSSYLCIMSASDPEICGITMNHDLIQRVPRFFVLVEGRRNTQHKKQGLQDQ